MVVSPIPAMFSTTGRPTHVRGCNHGRKRYCLKNSPLCKLTFLDAYFSAVSAYVSEKSPKLNCDYGRKLWRVVKEGIVPFTMTQQ